MARVQFTISDEERDRLVEQARQEGMTLSAWLRKAARELLEKSEQANLNGSVADGGSDPDGGSARPTGVELDWREYRAAILEGKPLKPFQSDAEVRAFFKACDSLNGPGTEPDWEDVKKSMSDDLMRRLPKT